MPVIIPPSRDRLGEVIVEAEAAGATTDTMRIARLRNGTVVLEVTQDVYDAWTGEHPEHPQDGDDDTADPESGDPDDGTDDDAPDDDNPDGGSTTSGKTRTRQRGTSRRS